MTGARSNRKPRPLSARVIRERFELRALAVVIAAPAVALLALAVYCATGGDAANVTADPASYALAVACVAGAGLTFLTAGAAAFAHSFRIR